MPDFTTFSMRAIGVLWDGDEEDPAAGLTYTPLESLAYGQEPGNAGDARAMSLASNMLGESMRDEAESIFLAKTEIELATDDMAEKRYQFHQAITRPLAMLSKFILFHAQAGQFNNIVLTVGSTITQTSCNQTNNEFDVYVNEYVRDSLAELGINPFVLFYDVAGELYCKLGFHIQRIEGRMQSPSEDEMPMRISWYHPDVFSNRHKIRDIEQVRTYKDGVPVDDIVA